MKILPNTQRLGKLTFDSNQVRKSSTNPNVLIAKASDGKDYGVVRKSDGSYDYAGSSRNSSFGDRMATASANPNIGTRLLETAGLLASEPQRMMTRKLTNNRYNNPEEVVADSKLPDGMLKNTLGLAAGMVIDPFNLVGAGAGIGVKASKYLPKLFKSSKIISKVDNIVKPLNSEMSWGKDYFEKLENMDSSLKKLTNSKTITNKDYLDKLDLYERELATNSGLGQKLGNGSYGSVYELSDNPSKVIKIGTPMSTQWTPELLENLKSVNQNANISIPEKINYFKIPTLNNNYKTREVLQMPNLDKVDAAKLDLNKRDRYAYFLKQVRQLKDKGIDIDVSNFKNFKFNENKGVFDIYDINPEKKVNAEWKDKSYINYMNYVRDKTKGPFYEDMPYKYGGKLLPLLK